jgi:hypothetical protein
MSSENCNVKVPDEGNGKVSSGSGNGDTIVASESSKQVSRVVFSNDQLDELSAEELRSHWRLQQCYIDSLEALNVTHEGRSACALRNDPYCFLVVYSAPEKSVNTKFVMISVNRVFIRILNGF